MDWIVVQADVNEWRTKNFPNNTLLGQCAGAVGEVAEALQHYLKLEDGRVDGEDHEDGIIDGFGDALVYMMGACDHLGISLESCFKRAWYEVQAREHATWGKDKAT
jgi:NTP pyrophosphatase (non-canonical NTP hydrolase)